MLLTILPAAAQRVPPEFQEKLDQIRSQPHSRWLELTAEATLPRLQDLVWPKVQQLKPNLPKPAISVRMEAAEDAPYLGNNQLVFPPLFLFRAYISGFLMSHDLYIDDGSDFPVPDPILQRPYAVSPLQKSLPLGNLKPVNPASPALLNMLNCQNRDQRCFSLQMITVSSALLFTLGYDYGHIAASDGSAREYTLSLEKEKAADAWALRLMSSFAPELANDEDRRDYFVLGPPALLSFLAASKQDTARDQLVRRKSALLGTLTTSAP